MRFSIIVPVYNVEEYLDDALRSIMNQNYFDYEIILVNDGSTDESLNICKLFAKQNDNITVIDKPNGGLSDARNAGLDVAKGEYIYFFDPDDYIHPDLLSTVSEYIDRDNIDMIQFYYQKFQNKQLREIVHMRTHLQFEKIYHHSDLIHDMYEFDNELIYTAWSFVVKKSILDNYNIKFIPDIINEDVPFFIDCLSRINTYVILSKPLYFYRLREGSISRNLDRRPRVFSMPIIIKALYEMKRTLKDYELKKWIEKKIDDSIYIYLVESFSYYESRYVAKKFGTKSFNFVEIFFKRIIFKIRTAAKIVLKKIIIK